MTRVSARAAGIDHVLVDRAVRGDRAAWQRANVVERHAIEDSIFNRHSAERQEIRETRREVRSAVGETVKWGPERDHWFESWAASVGEDIPHFLNRVRLRRQRGRIPPVPTPPTSPPAFDHEGKANCDRNPDYLILEAEAEDILSTVGGVPAERKAYLERAAENLCDGCPVRAQCKQWAESDPWFEGIADGRLIISTLREVKRERMRELRKGRAA